MLKLARVATPASPSEGAPEATAMSISDLSVVSDPTGGRLTAELSMSGLAGLLTSLLQTVTVVLSFAA